MPSNEARRNLLSNERLDTFWDALWLELWPFLYWTSFWTYLTPQDPPPGRQRGNRQGRGFPVTTTSTLLYLTFTLPLLYPTLPQLNKTLVARRQVGGFWWISLDFIEFLKNFHRNQHFW